METQNITNTISNTLNTLFTNLQKSLDENVFKILDEITFIDTDIINSKYFSNLLSDKSNGLIILANSLLFAILIYYGASFLFSHFSPSKNHQKPLPFLCRFVLCAILINYSEFICEQIIYVFSIITDCVREFRIFLFLY